MDVGQIKAGDFVVVSGAAGATGSVVAQIAKLKGCKVLGLAGSEDKCKWLVDDLGIDIALNYKDKDFKEKFRASTKGFIDVSGHRIPCTEQRLRSWIWELPELTAFRSTSIM